jgi:hypothetical protein
VPCLWLVGGGCGPVVTPAFRAQGATPLLCLSRIRQAAAASCRHRFVTGATLVAGRALLRLLHVVSRQAGTCLYAWRPSLSAFHAAATKGLRSTKRLAVQPCIW